jgi:hypothetical protein
MPHICRGLTLPASGCLPPENGRSPYTLSEGKPLLECIPGGGSRGPSSPAFDHRMPMWQPDPAINSVNTV